MSTKSVDLTPVISYILDMISPEQSRAARAWLEWSQDDLAKRANVSLSTIRDFEKGRRTPIANNLDAIQRALELAAIQFVFFDDGQPKGISCSASDQQKLDFG